MVPKLAVLLCAVLTYCITLIPKSNKTLITTDTLTTLTNLTILNDQKNYQLNKCRICIDFFDFLVFFAKVSPPEDCQPEICLGTFDSRCLAWIDVVWRMNKSCQIDGQSHLHFLSKALGGKYMLLRGTAKNPLSWIWLGQWPKTITF